MDYKKIKEQLDTKTDEELRELSQAYVDRMYYLIRAIENKHLQGFALNEYGMSYNQELDMIEQKRGMILELITKRNDAKIKEKVIEAKKTIKSDGNLKREIAQYIINLFDKVLSEDELKGVFRQGYKMMRG